MISRRLYRKENFKHESRPSMETLSADGDPDCIEDFLAEFFGVSVKATIMSDFEGLNQQSYGKCRIPLRAFTKIENVSSFGRSFFARSTKAC